MMIFRGAMIRAVDVKSLLGNMEVRNGRIRSSTLCLDKCG